MTDIYVLHRSNKQTLGPAFNEAAELLKQHPVLGYVDSSGYPDGKGGVIIAQAEEADVPELKKLLPGWSVHKVQDAPKR